jgi:hypothetical protein
MFSGMQRRDRVPEMSPVTASSSPTAPEKAVAPAAHRAPKKEAAAKTPPRNSVAQRSAPENKIPAAARPTPGAAQKPIAVAPGSNRPAAGKSAGGNASGKTEPGSTPPEAPAARAAKAATGNGDGTQPVESLPAGVGFALQAISWSERPDRRIAVISGRILKETEKVEDYTVIEINRDDVIFQRQGQRWRLGFRNK